MAEKLSNTRLIAAYLNTEEELYKKCGYRNTKRPCMIPLIPQGTTGNADLYIKLY